MQFNIGDTVNTPGGAGVVVKYSEFWDECSVKIGADTHYYSTKDITPVSASSCTEAPQSFQEVADKTFPPPNSKWGMRWRLFIGTSPVQLPILKPSRG